MKIITILGTRPEIIRLSRIIPLLDRECRHYIYHTNQNYVYSLNNIFFEQMKLRLPDFIEKHDVLVGNISLATQLSAMFKYTEQLCNDLKPDKVLILGDTNSALTAIIVERMNIPVYHMEAGNRCFDTKVPEEKNRRVIDAISSFNMPYTPNSKNNLLREGISENKIYVTGNPIKEVMNFYLEDIEQSSILDELNLKSKEYAIATFHRTENVDVEYRLKEIIVGLNEVSKKYGIPIVCSIHPRTKNKIETFGLGTGNLVMLEPLGFFDFVNLEKNAKIAFTDSGTVQEECCLLNVPTVTMRDSTERPETVDCGSNIVSGLSASSIVSCADIMINKKQWEYPEGYSVVNVSEIVLEKLLS